MECKKYLFFSIDIIKIKVVQNVRKSVRQTDRQIGSQASRWAARQTDRQTNRKSNRQKVRQTESQNSRAAKEPSIVWMIFFWILNNFFPTSQF